MRAPRPFFACTFALVPTDQPDDIVLVRVFAGDDQAHAFCMFADGSAETRWLATTEPPSGSGIGRGAWALIAVLGLLVVHGPEADYRLIQPGAVGAGLFAEALQFVRDRAPQWVEFTADE
jgi:hypothetical protein